MPSLRNVEWIVLAYFAYLTAVAWIRPAAARTRQLVTAAAIGETAIVLATAVAAGSVVGLAIRDWSPPVHVLVGYWTSGLLFDQPMPRLERRLVDLDAAVGEALGGPAALARVPRGLLELLELAYASVTPMLPLGFAAVYALAPRLDVDRYWTAVVIAELGCYGALPWLQTRPPVMTMPDAAIEKRRIAMRPINRRILDRASIQMNTIPSGHAAGSVATALAVWTQLPSAGPWFLLWAVLIVLGSLIGRYHYVADAISGIALAVAAWLVAG